MTPLKRVLLIDDDKVTNMLHRRVVERSGYALRVEVATDGQAALDILDADMAANRSFPELVFLDINMPGMGGFEFLENYARQIPTPNPQMIIVMLSTSLLQSDHDKINADPNVHSLCEKPLRLDDFLGMIKSYREKVEVQAG